MTAITKADVLKYLADVRSHFAAYHNHKESSAWAALVVYLVLLAQIVGSVKDKPYVAKLGAVLLIVVIFIAVSVYISAQLRRRRDAANYIAACLALSAEYLSIEEAAIQPEVFQLRKSEDYEHHSSHILPNVVLERSEELSKMGHGTRLELEKSMKMVLVVTSVAGLGMLLFNI